MSTAPARASTKTGCRAIMIAALLATYVQAVTISLPNASVFHIGGRFSMADDEIGWIFSSYIVASAVVMPMARWLAERFGRKTVFQTSILMFASGLIFAAQATSLLQFIAARVVQGAASGTLAPLSLAILLDEFPPSQHRRISLASAFTAMLGILSGPPIGGWLGEYHGWQSLFYAGLPLSALVFLLMALWLTEKKATQASAFDFFGLTAFSLGAIGLQMLLDRGERLDWFSSTEIRIEALASMIGFTLFLVHMLTTDRHFLDKRLFRDRNFVFSTILFFALGFVLLPTVALTSPMLEELLKYPADTTGYMTIPRSLALLAALMLASRAPAWIDDRLLIVLGSGLTVYANGLMTGYSPLMDGWPVLAAGMIQGAGLGLLMPALNRTAFSTLDPALQPEGTALFNLARLYGSTIGIAVVQIWFYNNTQMMHLALAGNVTLHAVTIQAPGLLSGPGRAILNEMVTGQAAAVALFGQFKLLMIVMLIASPLALLLRRPRPLASIQGAIK